MQNRRDNYEDAQQRAGQANCRTRWRTWFCALLVLGVLAVQSTLQSTQAATLMVTRTDDNDACSNVNDCPGTLRDALTRVQDGDIIKFNLGPGPKTIQLAQEKRVDSLTIAFTSLGIKKSITIEGPGADLLTIRGSGGPSRKVFEVGNATSRPTVTIKGLSITNGTNGGTNGSDGGGVGVYNANLTLDGCYIHDNRVVVAQQFTGGGTPIGFKSNAIAMGGGVYVDTNSEVTIRNSTIANNHVTAQTDFRYSDYPSSVYLLGGGVCNDQGTLRMYNTTIHGNSAGFGGGVDSYGDALTEIYNCTIAANTARKGSNGHGTDSRGNGGGFFRHRYQENFAASSGGVGTVRFYNTLIGLNTSRAQSNGAIEYGTSGVNIDGYIEDAFHNICPSGIFGRVSSGNNIQKDPLFQGYNNNSDYVPVLQYNGGPTPTVALTLDPANPNTYPRTSPAIDAGRNYTGLTIDQRGQPRPYDFAPVNNTNNTDNSDVGAYEMQEPQQAGSTLTVNKTGDHNDGVCGVQDCTLREAVSAANNGGINTIQFSVSTFPDGTNTAVNLESALPTITRPVTIQGRGQSTVTVRKSSGGTYSLFSVGASAGVNINDLMLGDATGQNGGAINSTSALTVNRCTFNNNRADSGGAIYSSNQLILNSCTFTGNSATGNGGAIASVGGSVTINSCTLAGNSATDDGGGVWTSVATAVNSSTVTGNSGAGGGGVFGTGTLGVDKSTFSNNRATSNSGGAISSNQGVLTAVQSTFVSNTASTNGGALTLLNAAKTVRLCTFSSNSAGADGGAVFSFNNGGTTLTACTVAGNSAGGKGGGVTNYSLGTFVSGTMTLQNTLIAANNASSSPDFHNETGGTLSGSYNLIQNPSGWSLSGTLTGDARLTALGSNGGLTQTIALRRGSPAVDKGNAFSQGTDQRGVGFARIKDNPTVTNASDGTDIGAFESQFTDTLQSGPNFEVNVSDDHDDDECSTLDCTLREAISAAEENADASTITFAAAMGGQTLNLRFADDNGFGPSAFRVSTPITITGLGNGITLARSANVSPLRLFRVMSSGNLTLQKLTLKNGFALGGTGGSAKGGGGGGGGGLGGAIMNEGTLRLEQSTLAGNSAKGGNGGVGGDIGASEFAGDGGAPNGGFGTGNGSTGGFGGGGGGGATGGARNGGDLNKANGGSQDFGYGAPGGVGGGGGGGGGGTLSGGFAPITGAHAGGNGGGGGGGMGLGGAICNKSGTVTIVNSTLSGNSTQGGNGAGSLSSGGGTGPNGAGFGGAIFNYNGSIALTNATIAFNEANGGGAIYNVGDGSGKTVSVSAKSSILSNSTGAADIDSQNFGNTATVSNTGTFNIIQNGSLDGNTGFINADPMLGTLKDNYGPTPTHELLSGSPALDKGQSTLTQDQRALLRIKDEATIPNAAGGDGSDIGAFELQDAAQLGSALVVNTLDDRNDGACTIFDCTLREAVGAAATTGSTISFKAGLNGTIALTSALGEIPIAKSLSIVGPGATTITVAGTTVSRIFNISSGTVSISGLKFSGGTSASNSNGGGAIRNDGTLTVDGCIFANNRDLSIWGGGGIYSRGTLTVTRSTFDGNTTTASDGGGGIAFFGLTTSNSMSVSTSTFLNNSAPVGGGLRLLARTGTVTNCTFSNNTAADVGGGLQNSATMTLSFCTFSGNNAVNGGGGVRQGGSGSVTMSHCILSGNKRNGSTTATGADLNNGSWVEGGYNLIQNDTGYNFTGTNNITGQDAKLGPLQSNGGPTQTFSLLAGSPAIDSGDPANTQTLDQRARPRPRDGDGNGTALVDMGALEATPAQLPVIDLNGGAAGLGYNATFTQNGGAVFIEDPNALSVTAPDSTTLSFATVTFANRPDGAAETLSASPSGMIAATDIVFANDVLSINKVASLADYQAVLRSVRYNNSSSAPNTAVRGIDFVINDGASSSAPATAVVSVVAVNHPPVNNIVGNQSTLEDTELTFSGAGKTISISDADAGSSGVRVTLGVTKGALSLSRETGLVFTSGANNSAAMTFTGTLDAINAALNGLRFVPAANDYGDAVFTITTNDIGRSGVPAQIDNDSFTITITPVNDVPSFTKGGDQTVNEDAGAQTVNDWATNISAGFNESDQTLAFIVSNSNTALFSAQPSISSNGTLTYTPAPNKFGVATVTVSLKDNGGTANGGADTSAPQDITITINSVNDQPTTSGLTDVVVDEDASDKIIDLHASFNDVEDGASGLVYSVNNNSNTSLVSTNIDNGTGKLNLHFAGNAYGSAQIKVRATDTGMPVSFVESTFTLTVTPVNDAPSNVTLSPANVDENSADGTIVGTLSTADVDDSAFSYSLIDNAGGRFSLDGDKIQVSAGNLLDYEINTSHQIVVRSTDNGGSTATNLSVDKTITIAINNVNEQPTANAGPDQDVIQSTSGVTLDGSGSSDPDGDTLTYLWKEGSTFLANGVKPSVNLSGGIHTITLTVTDPGGLSHSDEVIITVVPTASVADISVQELYSGNRNAVFTVLLSGTSSQTITVNYALVAGKAEANLDYGTAVDSDGGTPGTLTIPAGNTSGTITIPIIGDVTPESSENFSLQLSNPQKVSLLNNTAAATIVNAPTILTLSVDKSSFREDAGSGAATGTLVLKNFASDEGGSKAPEDVTFALSSSDTTEAAVPATVTLASSQSSVTFSINAIDDGDSNTLGSYDGDKLVTLSAAVTSPTALAALTSAQTSVPVTVTDVDVPRLLLSVDNNKLGAAPLPSSGWATISRNNEVTPALPDIRIDLSNTPTGLLSHAAFVSIPVGQATTRFMVYAASGVTGIQDVVLGSRATGYPPHAAADTAKMQVGNAPVVTGYNLSGRLTISTLYATANTPVNGATVKVMLTDGSVRTTQSASDGTYSFTGLPMGSYSVMIDNSNGNGGTNGWSWSPSSQRVTLPRTGVTDGAATNINFVGTPSTMISGTTWLWSSGKKLTMSNVTLTLRRGTQIISTVKSLSNGTYSFPRCAMGIYTVTATSGTSVFRPATINVTLSADNIAVLNQDFETGNNPT